MKFWERVAKGLGVKVDWLLYGDKIPESGNGGKEVITVKTVDSQGITDDIKGTVGNEIELGVIRGLAKMDIESGVLKPKAEPAPIFDAKGESSAKDTPALVFKKTSEVYELRDGRQHAIITISTGEEGKKSIMGLEIEAGIEGRGNYVLYCQQDIEFLHTAMTTALELVRG